MIIVLTEAKTKYKVTIEAGLVMCSRPMLKPPAIKGQDGIIVTHVITGIQVQGQLQAFEVEESPLEIGRRINASLSCTVPPDLLGYPLE